MSAQRADWYKRKMTKDERVAYYLDLASSPKMLSPDTSATKMMKELNVTDDDIEDYRHKIESRLSLKPTEKRNVVIKQVIKPLLKKYGFSVSGSDWHREMDDFYIIIHMTNSQYNSISWGACFGFQISAVKKEELKGELSKQWLYSQMTALNQFSFLPYLGMLSPYYAGTMYKIDGYQNYLPSDTPIENICRQIEEDFGTYILPELCAIESYEDFLTLRLQKLKRNEEKEIRLLRYYYEAQRSILEHSGSGYRLLVSFYRELNLSPEDIASHLEWLDIIRNNFPFNKVDAKENALKAVAEAEQL